MDARSASRNPEPTAQAEVSVAPQFRAFNRSSKKFLSRHLIPVDAALDPIQVLRILMDGLPPDVKHGLWLVNFRGVPVARAHSPFDLVYLDEELRVLQAAEISLYSKFVPFKGSPVSALVLPAGTNAASQTYTGDQLILEEFSASQPPPAPSPKRRGGKRPEGRAVPAANAKKFNVPQENANSSRASRVSGSLMRSAAQAVEPPAPESLGTKNEKAEDPVTKRIEIALEQNSDVPAAAPQPAPTPPDAIAGQASRLPIDAARIHAALEAIAPLESIEEMAVLAPPAALSTPESTPADPDLTVPSSAAPESACAPSNSAPTTPAEPAPAAAIESAAAEQLPPAPIVQPEAEAPSFVSDIASIEDSKERVPLPVAAPMVSARPPTDEAGQAAARPEESLQTSAPTPYGAKGENVATVQQVQVETPSNPTVTQPARPAELPPLFTAPAIASPVSVPNGPLTQASPQAQSQVFVAPSQAFHSPTPEKPPAPLAPGSAQATPEGAEKQPPRSAPPEPRPKSSTANARVVPTQARGQERKAPPAPPPAGEDPHLVINIDRATQQVMQAHQTDARVKAQTPKFAKRWDVRLLYRMFPELHPSYRPELETPRVDPIKEAQKKPKKPSQQLSKKVKVLHWLYPELGLDKVHKRQREVRRAPRIPVPGLVGYFFTGGVSLPFEIRNLSVMGFYMRTTERWMPGTIVRVTLQIVGTDGENPADSLTVHARVVHWDRAGAGFEFVLPGFEG